jgi:predicted anti-sigma-YlaC factor YlaD
LSDSLLHPGPDQLEAYVEGTLDTSDSAVVDSHLMSCARCQGEIEEWRSLFAVLSSMPRLAPTPLFADRVMARVDLALPLPARVAAFLARLVPKSTTGWALAAAMLSLPVVVIAAAVSWLATQPWVSTQALALFLTERLARGAAGLAVNVGQQILATGPALWVTSYLQALLGTGTTIEIGAIVAGFGTALVVSVWILYRNLFHAPSRDTGYASYSF